MATPPETLQAALHLLTSKQGGNGVAQSAEVQAERNQLDLLKQLPGKPRGGFASVAGELSGLFKLGQILKSRSDQRIPVIWITTFFPLQIHEGVVDFDSMHDLPELKYFGALYQKAIESLNEAHISVYPLEVTPSAWNVVDRTRDALTEFAQQAGGYNLDNRQIVDVVEDVRKSFSPYYSAVVESDGVTKHPDWVKLKITP